MKPLTKRPYVLGSLVFLVGFLGLETGLTHRAPAHVLNGYTYSASGVSKLCRAAILNLQQGTQDTRLIRAAFYGETARGVKTAVYDLLINDGTYAVGYRYGCAVHEDGRVEISYVSLEV